MLTNLGDVLIPALTGSTSPEESYMRYINGLTSYFNAVFMEKSWMPSFYITGAITTPSGATSPVTGQLGTVSIATIFPMTTFEFESFIKPLTEEEIKTYQHFKRLANVINAILTTKLLFFVDVKELGAMIPGPVQPFSFIAEGWGEDAQGYFDALRPSNTMDLISAYNYVGNSIWGYLVPAFTNYTSACAGGVLNCLMDISFGP